MAARARCLPPGASGLFSKITCRRKHIGEKLKDPRWQKKRLEILNKYGWECQKCRSNDKEMHVHHLVYDKGADPWEYDYRDLIPLCVDCHRDAEDREALRLFKLYMATTAHSVEEVRKVAEMINSIGWDEFGSKEKRITTSLAH